MHLEPSDKNARRLFERGIEGPVTMLNLLRFREEADYAELPQLAPPSPISGRAAYDLYVRHTLPFLHAPAVRSNSSGSAATTSSAPPTNDGTSSVPHAAGEILRQLDPLDARMLDLVYERSGGRAAYDGGLFAGGWQAESFNYELELPRGTITQARLDNLVRLGLAFHPTANLGRLRVNEPPIDRKFMTRPDRRCVARCEAASSRCLTLSCSSSWTSPVPTRRSNESWAAGPRRPVARRRPRARAPLPLTSPRRANAAVQCERRP